jgi:hypothetical protein
VVVSAVAEGSPGQHSLIDRGDVFGTFGVAVADTVVTKLPKLPIPGGAGCKTGFGWPKTSTGVNERDDQVRDGFRGRAAHLTYGHARTRPLASIRESPNA